MTIEDRMVQRGALNLEMPRADDVRVPSIDTGAERRRPTSGARISWADPQPFVRRDPRSDGGTGAAGGSGGATRWRLLDGVERRQPGWRRGYAARAVAADAVACVTAMLPVLATLSLRPGAVLALAGATTAGWLLALLLNRGYDGRRLGTGAEEFQAVIRSTWLGVAVAAGAAYTTGVPLPRRVVFVAIPLAGLLTMMIRLVLRRRLFLERRRGVSMARTLLVGDVASVAPVVRDLGRLPDHGYDVTGACIPADPFGEADGLPVAVLGAIGDVPQVVMDHDIEVVIVVGSQLTGQSLRRLSWALDRVGADLVVAPGVVEVAGPNIHLRPAAGLSLLHLEHPSRHLGRALGKMVLDRLLGTFLLLAAAAPLAVMAVAVALSSPGGVFFRQQRAGVDGRPFTMWKLRTMVSDAERVRSGLLDSSDRDGLMFKMRRDPRVTPVGRVLRRFSLDELPQLWNVVRGDMSLVGPRPPLMSEFEQYHDAVNRRLRVRPGLTGLWQVSGRADLSWEQSVDLDLRYVDNWSLALDLQILWRTARAVVGGSGAY